MGASVALVPVAIPGPVAVEPPSPQRAVPVLPWSVVTRHKGGSCAGVSVADDALIVFVSDTTDGAAGSMATLRADGGARVQCVRAPQSLLWTSQGHRLVPSLPGLADDLDLGGDDVLVLCSTAVLEYLPRGFGLAASRLARGTISDEEILAEMLSYATVGGAAIVRRQPTS